MTFLARSHTGFAVVAIVATVIVLALTFSTASHAACGEEETVTTGGGTPAPQSPTVSSIPTV